MLHLIYLLRPSKKARAHHSEFWQWVDERELWFYDGLEMASDPRWYVQTIAHDVHAIEHWISFEDEAAWGAYRKIVSERSRVPAWETRRVEQDEWWEILEARLLNDAPFRRATSR